MENILYYGDSLEMMRKYIPDKSTVLHKKIKESCKNLCAEFLEGAQIQSYFQESLNRHFGRAVETLGGTLKRTFKPSESREILESKGKVSQRTVYRIIEDAYKKEAL